MKNESITTQKIVNYENSLFWDELCGTGLAQAMGIIKLSPQNLEKFDIEYLNIYSYLPQYYKRENLCGKKVLEIGLGYGTLGQKLAKTGCDYYALDIARNPVTMMKFRLELCGLGNQDHIRIGSALNIPFEDSSFDYIYSIGCLHHTGNIPLAIQEIFRVVKPGGKVIIMLYNKHSFRQLVKIPIGYYKNKFLKNNFTISKKEFTDAHYDMNSKGEIAPFIEYVSKNQVREFFHLYRKVIIEVQNFDEYSILRGKVKIPRKILLNTIGRIAGLDLYITAIR